MCIYVILHRFVLANRSEVSDSPEVDPWNFYFVSKRGLVRVSLGRPCRRRSDRRYQFRRRSACQRMYVILCTLSSTLSRSCSLHLLSGTVFMTISRSFETSFSLSLC